MSDSTEEDALEYIVKGAVRNHVCELRVALQNPELIDEPPDFFRAFIDTGATGCAVSQDVARRLGLKTTGTRKFTGASGDEVADLTKVNLGLLTSTHTQFFGPVTTSIVTQRGFDVIVGMSILMRGVLNVNGPAGTWTLNLTPLDHD